MIGNTVNTEAVTTFQGKKVFFIVLIIAYFADFALTFLTGFCLSVNEIFVETFAKQSFSRLTSF